MGHPQRWLFKRDQKHRPGRWRLPSFAWLGRARAPVPTLGSTHLGPHTSALILLLLRSHWGVLGLLLAWGRRRLLLFRRAPLDRLGGRLGRILCGGGAARGMWRLCRIRPPGERHR